MPNRVRLLIVVLILLMIVPVSMAIRDATPEAPDDFEDEIVFVSVRDGDTGTWLMDGDGGNQRLLTPDTITGTRPSWHPSGERLVVTIGGVIYTVDRDGGNRVALSDPGAGARYPTWSPDGETIAYFQGSGIWLMDADGENKRLLTDSGRADAPAWSPDGEKVLFQSTRGGGGLIVYEIEIETGNIERITPFDSGDARVPWYSPDGESVVFACNVSGNYEIYITEIGGETVQITDSPTFDTAPSYSPDGQKIAWMTDRDGNFNIYVMDLEEMVPRAITNTGRNSGPVWKPFPLGD